MTIREMFQKIEKAGFADIQMTRSDGLSIFDTSRHYRAVVTKDITPDKYLCFELNLDTGDQTVEEWERDDNRKDYKLVGRTYLDDEGKPITNKQRLEER